MFPAGETNVDVTRNTTMMRSLVKGFVIMFGVGILLGAWDVPTGLAQERNRIPATDTVCRPAPPERPGVLRIQERLAGFQDSNLCSGGIPKYSKLCEAKNGRLYGLTCYGGRFNAGVLFEYDPSGNHLEKKWDFDTMLVGANPYGSLMLASDGRLYGLTRSGGLHGAGVLFSFDPVTDQYYKYWDFQPKVSGTCPYGSLTEGPEGKLFGMTSKGGQYSDGVLFVYELKTHQLTKLVDFENDRLGRFPHGSLVTAPNGKMYALTREGGTHGYGTLVEFDPATNTLRKCFDFDGREHGCFPRGDLVVLGDGLLGGVTASGGASMVGVLFTYNTVTGEFRKVRDFSVKADGICPLGSLMLTPQHELLGMTYQGGEYGFGVLYAFDAQSGAYTKVADFDGMNGKYPFGSLVMSSTGCIYGMTQFGGVSGGGVLFEYDPDKKQIVKIADFRGYSGGGFGNK